jgi:hypothetical protein
MNENTREVLTAAEIEEGIRQVSRHLGATPGWITRLLAGVAVAVERWQLAYFAAWKARFGVTETEKPGRTLLPETARGQAPAVPRGAPAARPAQDVPEEGGYGDRPSQPILGESETKCHSVTEWHEPTTERTNEPEEEPPW